MAKIYYVTIKSTGVHKTIIKIIDSFIGSDTWEGDRNAIGVSNGRVASWGLKAAVLHTGPGVGGAIILDSFGKNTNRGDTGIGSKSNAMGSFPDGDLSWQCDDVD
ncbi:MAG: hypothetical protein Q8Q80_19075 [Methyloversatilis sp.]|uniref:hypothetical protein n=1 Tax=Methyloversatilis sp. TaxID=2569862 RepID=UPI0027365B07|nr:hypothetical protein [Methyloversatilis sp.]MDP3874769.1 hypothetical protein [Methyloversatilis sp.]